MSLLVVFPNSTFSEAQPVLHTVPLGVRITQDKYLVAPGTLDGHSVWLGVGDGFTVDGLLQCNHHPAILSASLYLRHSSRADMFYEKSREVFAVSAVSAYSAESIAKTPQTACKYRKQAAYEAVLMGIWVLREVAIGLLSAHRSGFQFLDSAVIRRYTFDARLEFIWDCDRPS
jgi:hypothetical protein